MDKDKSQRFFKFFIVALIIIILLFIKIFHQKDNKYDYKIILSPTVFMVEILTGYSFIFVDDTGYVSQNEEIIISKKCAGINLFILSIFISLITGFKYVQKIKIQIIMNVFYIIASFFYTILINSIRIAFSINFEPLRRSFEILSRANNWIHYGIGTFIFVSSLTLYYFFIKRSRSWAMKTIFIK